MSFYIGLLVFVVTSSDGWTACLIKDVNATTNIAISFKVPF